MIHWLQTYRERVENLKQKEVYPYSKSHEIIKLNPIERKRSDLTERKRTVSFAVMTKVVFVESSSELSLHELASTWYNVSSPLFKLYTS